MSLAAPFVSTDDHFANPVAGIIPGGGAKAWVNFDGTSCPGGWCTVRGSSNIAGVQRSGTGAYTIYFLTPMPDANYAPIMSNNGEAAAGNSGIYTVNLPGAFSIRSYNSEWVPMDYAYVSGAVFR